jgi:hypothetical protein
MSRTNRVMEENVSSFKELMKDYESPYEFYRSIYKSGVGVNITVRFQLNNEVWEMVGDKLPRQNSIYNPLSYTPSRKIEITGVGISSIVEGSDAEIPLVWTEPHTFWETLEHVEDEASDMWSDCNWESNTIETLKDFIFGWLECTVYPVMGGGPENHEDMKIFIMQEILRETIPSEYGVKDAQRALRNFINEVRPTPRGVKS